MQNTRQTRIIYHGSGERIDTWLTTQFTYARNFFHHIISRGGILVNNKLIKKSYKLKSGDQVIIDDLTRFLSSEILAESPVINLPIVHEKNDYLVLYKPKGVLSHPNSVRDIGQPSVVGFLYHHYKNLPSIGNFIRAGLLHRLDKETDGLMIVAKTEKGLAYFKSLFQQKSGAETIAQKESVPLHKYYKATTYLTTKGQQFLDNIVAYPHYIQKNVIAKVPHTTPKLGITKILNIEKIETTDFAPSTTGQLSSIENADHFRVGIQTNKVIIDIEILTGRTHQIRYHLSEHGFPIVDDYLYGTDEGGQMQLSAYMLTFVDCDGEDVKCTIP